MSPPDNHRSDLVLGRPLSDAEAKVECARIAAAARVRIAWIRSGCIAITSLSTTAGVIALHVFDR